MNLQEKTRRTIEIYNLLDKSYAIKTNTIRINTHNTREHELAKCLVALELLYLGKTIITEAIFKNGKRADLICIEDRLIYEITHTEKPDGHKEQDYPLPILYIKADKILKMEMIKKWKTQMKN